ncbi:low molecular weight protein-tyrosine-phosphatase [Lactococcus nasutitermitis]|uniref:protein-tyrosine-phosphatase n=1 Tax=Lactococcus nasutitermitis TaxID=1652957 RepID=A0ABV9JEM7_9LACT|nr:low molecular weight protein-tyrosine-phosphatase [Lactococcus nasutitermitis]
MKIVFVCLGNICRSPMAEFVMKDLLEKAGRAGEITVESRATSSWEHGNPIFSGTQNILTEHCIEFDKNKKSQKITNKEFTDFDKIIAMDMKNLTDLSKMATENVQNKLSMLLDESVPDPWFTGDFEETYRLVKKGCEKLLTEI